MSSDYDLPTARILLEDAVARLEAAGVTSPRRNAEWLLCEALGRSRAGLLSSLDEPISPPAAGLFSELLERRLKHEPLQYILGFTEFYGMRLNVTRDVLIPRPETEQVVEEALRILQKHGQPRVLDVGTGSGCIAVAIKAQRGDAHVWACDVSELALDVAESNAALNGVPVTFFKADALADAFVQNAPGVLDLMISNPPYVSEAELETLPDEVVSYEPHLALFSRHDPIMFYRRLGAAGLELLKGDGYIVFETHADFGAAAASVLEELGYVGVELMKDYANRPRILRARRPNSGVRLAAAGFVL